MKLQLTRFLIGSQMSGTANFTVQKGRILVYTLSCDCMSSDNYYSNPNHYSNPIDVLDTMNNVKINEVNTHAHMYPSYGLIPSCQHLQFR